MGKEEHGENRAQRQEKLSTKREKIFATSHASEKRIL